MTPIYKPLYKVSEAMAALSISRGGFYSLVNDGLLPTHKRGKFTVVRGEDLKAYVDSLPVREAA